MKTKTKLIKVRNIHDVTARDALNGKWHSGVRLPDSETVAFYFRGAWYASVPGRKRVTKQTSKDAALCDQKGKRHALL